MNLKRKSLLLILVISICMIFQTPTMALAGTSTYTAGSEEYSQHCCEAYDFLESKVKADHDDYYVNGNHDSTSGEIYTSIQLNDGYMRFFYVTAIPSISSPQLTSSVYFDLYRDGTCGPLLGTG